MDAKTLKTIINGDEYQEYIQSIITRLNNIICDGIKFFYLDEYQKEDNANKKEILKAICFFLSNYNNVNSIVTKDIIKNKIIEKIEGFEKMEECLSQWK